MRPFRFVFAALVAAATLVGGNASAGAVGSPVYSYVKTTVTGSTWQGWIWGGQTNPSSGNNYYLRIDNGDTPSMYVRWRNCAGTNVAYFEAYFDSGYHW